MNKLRIIFNCFGFMNGLKYLLLKFIAAVLKKIYNNLIKIKFLKKLIIKTVSATDNMVEDYIYIKYQFIYDKYSNVKEEGTIPQKKILWTAWLQGVDDLPYAIGKCLDSMKRNSGEYEVVVLTLDNINKYIEIDKAILGRLKKKEISAAHFTDYLRFSILEEYGGVWFDASMYLTKAIPQDIWDYELIVWNKIEDITKNDDSYIAIPFVKEFNNGFLVGRKKSIFYQFCSDISGVLLSDPILKIDYFGNFKAIFAAKKHIDIIDEQWDAMRVINPYGLITRQLWNEPVTPKIEKLIGKKDSFFFTLTYKKTWIHKINGQETIQEYIARNY
ncbi:capsular polysaccharide synthesis protein [Latilactobacillus sakei]|uniref:capsular polysaccharide synthesis protein n=1 Tax=Latilactobacillus sakei TaxID=1599 RepID=UPI003F53E1DA